MNDNQRPCLNYDDPHTTPRASKGSAYTLDQCRLCWLYLNDRRYQRDWDGLPERAECVYDLGIGRRDHTGKDYRRCGHPMLPLGSTPCKCDGCGNPDRCSGFAEELGAIFEHGAGGIGDGLLASLAVRRYVLDNPETAVTFKVSSTALPFVELFDVGATPALSSRVHTEAAVPGAKQINVGYDAEWRGNLSRTPRWERYARNIGASGIERPALRNPDAIRAIGSDLADHVVLSPWSTDAARTWPFARWLDLEHRLRTAGYRTAILHDGHTVETRAFRRSVPIIGESAARVTAVVANARVVVSNDSGMAHLGGILGKPTIVLGAFLSLKQIYGCYPWVVPIEANAIEAIPATRVMSEIDDIYLKHMLIGDRSLLDATRLATIRDQVIATNYLPGACAELGVFRGGSAKVIATYAPDTTLHLFDTFAGIPDDDVAAGGVHKRGEFAGSLDDVYEYLSAHRIEYHVGMFPAMAPQSRDLLFRFAHIDGDTYQTTRAACQYFGPRMVPGGVIVFDDVDWPSCPGVRQALDEFFSNRVEKTADFQGMVRFS